MKIKQTNKQHQNTNDWFGFGKIDVKKNAKVIPMTHGSLLPVLSSLNQPLVDNLSSNKNVKIQRDWDPVFSLLSHFQLGLIRFPGLGPEKLEGLGSVHTTAHESSVYVYNVLQVSR